MTVAITRSRAVRALYVALGFLSLALGIVGIAVPLMPTTVFVLLAAYFFARSSQRLHRRLLASKHFGSMIRDYQAGLGVPMRAKVWATAAICVTFGISMATVVTSLAARIILGAVGTGIIWYIVSRPTRQPASVEAG